MNIVLGVCGFGLGHSTRQRPILEGLIARGHKVMLIANDQSYQFFTQNYPQIQTLRVYVPIMYTTPRGLDFARTASDPRNALPEATPAFWNACGLIAQEFGRPDMVISDYDMVSGQIAYLFGAPLITLDQQSKFLGYAFPDIGDFNPNEHRMRLGYFFPKAKARVATSFFKVAYKPVAEYPVRIIPPIIGHDVKVRTAAPIAKQVTVYISAASRHGQSFDDLARVFSFFPDYTFFCFTEGHTSPPPANVVLMANARATFLDCLCQSSAVVATAGHNLITEALYFHIPMFLLPFPHYEQQLNAHIITSEGLGSSDHVATESNLRAFFDRLDQYRKRESPLIYRQFNGDTTFLDFIQTLER